ncbi:MAG: hypothetical protein AAGK09_10010 [Planctomycetota bacterium]
MSGWWRRLRHTDLLDLLRGRVTGAMDWRTHLAESGLPEPQRAWVEAVIRHARLPNAIDIGIAHDLIADLQARRAASAEALGDPALAAALIRRAKRREFRRMAPVAYGTLGVVVLAWSILALRFYGGEPQITTDYLAQLNAPIFAIPEHDRGWPAYRAALLDLALDEQDQSIAFPMRDEDGQPIEPDDDDWPALATALKERAPMLESIRQATAYPALGLPLTRGIRDEDAELFPDTPRETDIPLDSAGEVLFAIYQPHLGLMRRAAELLAADARLAGHEGDSARMLASLEALMRMGDHAAEQPTLIAGAVGVSFRAQAIATAGELLRDPSVELDADRLAAMGKLFDVPPTGSLIDLAGEKAVFDDLLQRMFTDDGHGDGRFTDEGLALLRADGDGFVRTPLEQFTHDYLQPVFEPINLPLEALNVESRGEFAALSDAFYDIANEELGIPMWQRWTSEATPLMDRVYNDPRLSLLSWSVSSAPAVSRMTAFQSDDQRQGLRAAIALERYRLDHGVYPSEDDGLEALVPTYLDAVPVGGASGQPMRFVLRDGEPRVYGFGGNGRDNGGVLPAGEDPTWTPWTRARSAFARPGDAADGDWVVYPIPDR